MARFNLKALATGSSGNCYLLSCWAGDRKFVSLIDVGISIKKLKTYLAENDLNIADVEHIFITHEHSDHLSNIHHLLTETRATIYLTAGTLAASLKATKLPASDRVHIITAGKSFSIDELVVNAHKTPHDGRETVCYSFELTNKKIAIISDLGAVTEEIQALLNKLCCVFFEFNYDEEMMTNGNYPEYLKRRITNNQGHLSNSQAFEALKNCRSLPNILVAIHLSKNNNKPEIVESQLTSLGYQVRTSNLDLIDSDLQCVVLPHGQGSQWINIAANN